VLAHLRRKSYEALQTRQTLATGPLEGHRQALQSGEGPAAIARRATCRLTIFQTPSYGFDARVLPGKCGDKRDVPQVLIREDPGTFRLSPVFPARQEPERRFLSMN
jgi:hypothetical protein